MQQEKEKRQGLQKVKREEKGCINVMREASGLAES